MSRHRVVILFGLLGLQVFTFYIHSFYVDISESQNANESESFRISGASDASEIEGNEIAIIGGGGYIGACMERYFKNHLRNVTVFDRSMGHHSSALSVKEVRRFNTVIFLGGCSNQKSCSELDESARHRIQVHELVEFVHKMNRLQHLITVSSAEVLEGTLNAKETDTIFVNRLGEFSRSMYNREIALREFSSPNLPKVSILRLGSVVGLSPNQRTDHLIPALFKSAYTSGILHLEKVTPFQPFLWLKDLCRAVEAVIFNSSRCNSFPCVNLWHVSSFNARVLKVATSIAALTGARLDVHGNTNGTGEALKEMLAPSGVSLNCEAFEREFSFKFEGTLDVVLSEIDYNVPGSISDEHRVPNVDGGVSQCPVCGSTESEVIFGLGHGQKKILRCMRCNHVHSSETSAEPSTMTQHPSTANQNSNWLFDKILRESGHKKNGSILEFTFNNENSFADRFSHTSWNIYSAKSSKHRQSRYWETNISEVESFTSSTAILIDELLSYVTNPVGLLKHCTKWMDLQTKLYITISHCSVLELYRKDTIYKDQVSYFSGHSLVKATELAGLNILDFERIPNVDACVLTSGLLSRKTTQDSESIDSLLEQEREQGLPAGLLGEKFRSQYSLKRNWISSRVKKLRSQGFIIGLYGTDLTGYRYLHHMFGDFSKSDSKHSELLDFVLLQDTPANDTKYFGTNISIIYTNSSIADLKGRKALIILPPSAAHENARLNALYPVFNDHENIFVLKSFANPQIVKLGLNQVLSSFEYRPTKIPNPLRDENRQKVTLYSHLRNEALLLPFFIIHHAHMFDSAVLMDFLSDDESLQLIEQYAPTSWKVVNSSTGAVFDLVSTDQQLSQFEAMRPNEWAIVLTIPEFLIHPNLRLKLWSMNKENPGMHVLQLTRLEMVGNDTVPLHHLKSLPKQRYVYTEFFTNRYLHYGSKNTYDYKTGRHRLVLVNGTKCSPKCTFPPYTGGFVMAYAWTPWPEAAERKLAVGKNFPPTDVKNRRGFQHTERMIGGMKYLEKERAKTLGGPLHSLCSISPAEFPKLQWLFDEEFHDACWEVAT